MNQSTLYKIADILFAILSLFNIVFSMPALLNGPGDQGSAAGIPQFVIVLAALTGIAGLIAAYGAWKGQKWGIWLALIISAINMVSALPGVLFAPNAFARVSAITGVAISGFIIIALLRRPKAAITGK